MIALAIALDMIENEIANTVTSNKTPKEHLENLKEKFKRYKHKKEKDVYTFTFRSGRTKVIKTKIFEIQNGFIKIEYEGKIKYINTEVIYEVIKGGIDNDSMCSS